jgi:hypothetical protein
MKIEDAIKIVNSWPEWKKHLVENSMNPTCPTRGYGKRIESTTANKMDNKTKEELKKEVIEYIKDNLTIDIKRYLDQSVHIELSLEGKVFSKGIISIKNE